MKVYYVRHQAAGVVHERPFVLPPTAEQLAPVLALCAERHGTKHPKTGAAWWAKVVEVDTDAPDEPRTVACAHGGSAEAVDARASGPCPIRSGEHVPEPDHAGPPELVRSLVAQRASMQATGVVKS